MRGATRGAWAVPAAIIAAWALLLTAWVFGNPPFAGPDEPDHYVRAVGAGELDLTGVRGDFHPPANTPQLKRWVDQSARAFKVPPGLAPLPVLCYIYTPLDSARCLDLAPVLRPRLTVTPEGGYEPLPYILPGLAIR